MDLKALQASPAKFRSALRIDCDGRPQRLGAVMDRWQRCDFFMLDPGWQQVAGQEGDGPLRAWLERPRGHAKSSDVMVQATWALFASRRQITGIVAAVDRDQAKLDRDHVERFVRLNPWLGQILKVDQWRVSNTRTGSSMEILSSDVASSYGLLIDFAILDEVTLWPKRELFDSILSAAAKKASCMLLCIGNAGFQDSWQWEVREVIQQDEDLWYFSRLDGPQASWITPDRLAEQRRLLPPIAYRRLWLNQWSTGSGDALDHDDIQRAITERGPLTEPEEGWLYVAGLDLGLSKDASALVTVGLHTGWAEEIEKPKRKLNTTQRAMIDLDLMDEPDQDEPEPIYHEGTGKMRVADVQVWHPKPGRKLDLEPIERAVVNLDRRFRLVSLGYDPWQSEYLAERVRKQGVPVQAVPFQAANLQGMAQAVLEAFNEGLVELYESGQGGQLVQDLRNLRVEERSYGIRLTSPRGPSGHGDCATALSIALLMAKRESVFTSRPPSTIIVY